MVADFHISRFRVLLSRFSTRHLWLNARSVVLINVLEGLEKRDAHERKTYGCVSTGGRECMLTR